MAGDELMGLVAIVLIFGTPVIITGCVMTMMLLNNLLKQREKENARRAFKEVLNEKTEVLKTAILIGYSHDEIVDLDKRLEQLVGSKKLHELISADSNRLRELEAREQHGDLESELLLVQNIREARNA